MNEVDSVMGIVPEVHDDDEYTMSVSDSDRYHVLPTEGAVGTADENNDVDGDEEHNTNDDVEKANL